ncbi:type II toxin-antitoxin system PemK/MazF family toxin [Candidatus Peregrinibacteria bacterium]|jgi:mRNA interferase MazF|nr:type II toxin-antitoxin system PemK/MazF family toxin [Candidatus Peregrinibacteria bacterium]
MDKRKIFTDRKRTVSKNKNGFKGGFIWCNFGLNIGSEFSSVTDHSVMRPCIIVKNNAFIRSGNTVVIPITKYDKSKKVVFTDVVIIPTGSNKLKMKSIVKVANIRDISKVRLGLYIGKMDKKDMNAIETKILMLFDIK